MARTDFPRPGNDWKAWAEDLVAYFKDPAPRDQEVAAAPILLSHIVANETARATTAGILLFDPVTNLPIFSDGSAFINLATMQNEFASNYMVIGGMLIQWGKEVASVASETITFPVAFNDTSAVVIVSAQTHAYPSTITTADFLMTGTNTEDKYWIAIGPAA